MPSGSDQSLSKNLCRKGKTRLRPGPPDQTLHVMKPFPYLMYVIEAKKKINKITSFHLSNWKLHFIIGLISIVKVAQL